MEVFRPEDVPAEEPENLPGVKIRWIIDRKRGATNFAMRLFEVAPGASTPLHDHWYEQEMFMLEGEGVLAGESAEHGLRPGLAMWVPPGERHQVRNTGAAPMKFICCVPIKKG